MQTLLRNLSRWRQDHFGRLVWNIKQLLPLHYQSHYKDGDGRAHYAQWRMWVGRCFWIDDRVIS